MAEKAAIDADPELARQRERDAADGRGVSVGEDVDGSTKTLFIVADADDVDAFDQALDQVADQLDVLGDPDSKDIRRSKASASSPTRSTPSTSRPPRPTPKQTSRSATA